MKYDISTIDQNNFDVVPYLIAGETCYLVTPQRMGVDWTQSNKVLRSSVWDSSGKLISASFPKFVNWGEKPEVFPVPNSLKNTTVVEKLDGSLLSLTRYNGQIILRTRGTVDARKLDNGVELAAFQPILDRVSRMYESLGDIWGFSLIWEWLSPTNKIVLDYGPVPLFKLIGKIDHEDYSLSTQKELDTLADILGVDRPETFTFGSTEELISSVEQWKGKEGVCVYSKGGQEIHKIKAASYLLAHRFKENATFEHTVDLFFEFGMPSYQDFQSKLVDLFDWECANMVLGYCSTICDGFKEVNKIVDSMKSFVEPLKNVSRKEAAQKILGAYANTNRGSFCFQILDGKTLDKDSLKKLLYQVTKK